MFSEAPALLFARGAGTSSLSGTEATSSMDNSSNSGALWLKGPSITSIFAIANRAHTRATRTIRRHIVLTHGARGSPPIPPNSCRAPGEGPCRPQEARIRVQLLAHDMMGAVTTSSC